MIEKGGVKMPKLDFTAIYLAREAISSHNENSNESDEEQDEEYYEEEDGGEEMDSKSRKEMFEK